MVFPDSAVTAITAGLVEEANGGPDALPNPQFEVIYEYSPKNGPKALDFTVIHESVWRGWDADGQLPEQVSPVDLLGLAARNARSFMPQHQHSAEFSILGFALMYDEPLEPGAAATGDGRPDRAATRLVIAVDLNYRCYELLLVGGHAPGPVQVSEPVGALPAAASPLLENRRSAMAALIGVVHATIANAYIDRLAPDPADDSDDAEEAGVLVAGELVTVTGERFDDDDRRYLWVVVDYFDNYTIAVLGGDGYQWPNVERGELIPVAPECIRRVARTDDTYGYLGTDTAEPDPAS